MTDRQVKSKVKEVLVTWVDLNDQSGIINTKGDAFKSLISDVQDLALELVHESEKDAGTNHDEDDEEDEDEDDNEDDEEDEDED